MEICTNCRTGVTSEHVCSNCGLVSDVPEMVLSPPRSYDLDEPNREASEVRADLLMPSNLAVHDFGLGSLFDGSSVDGDVEKHELFARMETLNETEFDESSRSLQAAMCSIDAIGKLLDLPNYVERRVAYLYRKVRNENLTQGRDLRAVLGALVVMATKEAGIPRARETVLGEVNKLSSSDPQIGRHYKHMNRNVSRKELRKSERDIKKALDLDVPTPKPKQYIPRFATEIDLNGSDAALASHICRFVDTNELSSDPKLAASAVLYAVGKKQTTRKEISEKLPVGYTARLSTMADKVIDLIHDQVYDPTAEPEVEPSESLNWLERKMRSLEARWNLDKIGEAKELLHELLKRQGLLPPLTANSVQGELADAIYNGLFAEENQKSNPMYG